MLGDSYTVANIDQFGESSPVSVHRQVLVV